MWLTTTGKQAISASRLIVRKERKPMKRITMILTAALLIAPAAFAARVDRRQVYQQKRIAQGVASGALTPHETITLERQEARLQHEKADMREDHGGKLTYRDKAVLNHQQNRLSREIYRDKHNRRYR
jgi:hypothetical protein